MLKMEHHIKFFVTFVNIFKRIIRRHHRRFANCKAIVFICYFSVFTQIFMDIRAVHIMLNSAADRKRNTVRKPRSFWNKCYNILSKTVNPHIKPKFHYILNLLPYLWVIMVKVGLFFCENVEIIFSAFFILFPSLALKAGKPIVRRKLTAEPAFAPKIIIVIWRGRVFGFNKPFVLVRRVINNKVHNNLHSTLVCAVEHLPKQIEIAVFLMYIFIVGNIVAKVSIRWRIKRRKPNAIYAQILQIIKLWKHTLKVAYSVAVAVAKRARPNLINN